MLLLLHLGLLMRKTRVLLLLCRLRSLKLIHLGRSLRIALLLLLRILLLVVATISRRCCSHLLLVRRRCLPALPPRVRVSTAPRPDVLPSRHLPARGSFRGRQGFLRGRGRVRPCGVRLVVRLMTGHWRSLPHWHSKCSESQV